MKLVSLEQASLHLRRDTDDDDADLQLKIEAASEAIADYLKDAANAFLDSSGNVPEDSNGDPVGVPARVRAATLELIGHMYKERDGGMDSAVSEQFGYGYLPKSVISLLYSMRRPTVV
jgi:hypothetical protein